MNAKNTDLGRVQEIYNVVTQTINQIESLGITRERFTNPKTDQDDLLSEGVMNRVFRVVEEAGRISDEVARTYEFDTVGARGARNRLAHTDGEVDREIVWNVVEHDFDSLLRSCESFCSDAGYELRAE